MFLVCVSIRGSSIPKLYLASKRRIPISVDHKQRVLNCYSRLSRLLCMPRRTRFAMSGSSNNTKTITYLTRYRWARKQIYKGWRGPLRGRPAVQLGVYYSYNTVSSVNMRDHALALCCPHASRPAHRGGRDAVLCMGSTGDIDGYRHTRLQ